MKVWKGAHNTVMVWTWSSLSSEEQLLVLTVVAVGCAQGQSRACVRDSDYQESWLPGIPPGFSAICLLGLFSRVPLQVLNPKEVHAPTHAWFLQQLSWFPFTTAFSGHTMKERHLNKGKRKGLDASVGFEKFPTERSWELSESQHVRSLWTEIKVEGVWGERQRSPLKCWSSSWSRWWQSLLFASTLSRD